MSLTRTILGNRHAVWALVIGSAIFGALAYLTLPMQLFPDTSPPVVNVIAAYPGASASDVADGLSRPLEEEFAGLEGIVRVRATSQDNLSIITLEFQYDIPTSMAAVDVQNAVARIRDTLPQGIREPQILEFSTSDRPVVSVGVRADDLSVARKLAEDALAPRLQRVPGVAAVDVFGGAVPAVLVEVDREAAEALRVPLARVAEQLVRQNTALPGGRIRTETTETMFRVEMRAHDVDALGRIALPLADGSRVELRDLARIRVTGLDDESRFAIDGKPAVAMQVLKTTEANTVDVVRRVEAAVQGLGADFPNLELLIGEESASFTETVVNNLLNNVWQALLLASVIIFLFLGRIRSSLVAAVSMPLSYALTFALMKLFGIELNMVTLSAIILAVGMVVDASVVVLENVTRVAEAEGLDRFEAAVKGTDEIRFAVLAGAATTIVVLIPLLFTGGFVGKTFGPLAATLLLAFLSSVVVALVLVPVLSLYTGGSGRLDRLGQRIAAPFGWLMDRFRGLYLALLRAGLRWRLATVVLALAVFAAGLVGLRLRGTEVLPQMDGGSFFVSLETPPGSSLEETGRAVRAVERILLAEPEVVKVQSQVGFEAGMRSFAGSGVQGPTQGFVTTTLTPRTERVESIWSIEARVRERLAQVPNLVSSTVRELGNTAKSTTSAPIVVRLSGSDPLVLDRLAVEVEDRIRGVESVVAPLRSWRLDQRRTEVQVDRLRAGQLGLTPAEVAGLLRAGSDGLPAGEFHGVDGSPLPLRVRYARPDKPTTEDVLRYPVLVPGTTDVVPLGAVASLRETVGPGLVTREDLQPTIEVSAFARGRSLSFVIVDVERALAGITLPRGYDLELTGENRDMQEAQQELGGALAIALLAIYLLLVAQFRSFVHPLTVMVAVPLSLSGVAAALWIAGQAVSMPVMVSLILLTGTVVNNSIILVDFVRQRREAGQERREALLESVATRFRPIMMTSLSTVVGMIPLAAEWALGAERFSPLATAVIGGMTAATLLTMVVIPVLYDLLDSAAARLRRTQ